MGATTALAIETAAFTVLQVFQPGDPIPAADSAAALGFLNRMVGGWSRQNLTIPSISRELFPLVSGKGSPANPYTIGTGGNLNTARPPAQSAITGAGLLLNATDPPVEIDRVVVTDDQWRSIAIKGLTSTLFTSVYYNPSFSAGLGAIYLWPVPTDLTNSLVLYMEKPLTQFVNQTATYYVPDGYEEALVYNLCRRMAKPWGGTLDSDTLQLALSGLSLIKRSNVKMSEMPNDFAVDRRTGYNINTGQ